MFPKEKKLLWHSLGDVEDENCSEIIAEQKEALQTKYHETQIIKNWIPDQRLKKDKNLPTECTLLSAYTSLTVELYIRRNDGVCVKYKFLYGRKLGWNYTRKTSMKMQKI